MGSSLAYFSLGHPQVRSISGQVRSTLFWDAPVKAAVRFAFWLGLVYFSKGCSEVRSNSGRVRPIVLGSVCEVWVRSTLGHASLTCRSDTRRSYLLGRQRRSCLFRSSACVNCGTLYTVASLAYVSPVHPKDRSISGHVRPTMFLRSACAIYGPPYFVPCLLYFSLVEHPEVQFISRRARSTIS